MRFLEITRSVKKRKAGLPFFELTDFTMLKKLKLKF